MPHLYSLSTPMAAIAQQLNAKVSPLLDFQPCVDASPTCFMPIITNEFSGIIQFYRWGLVPKWARDLGQGTRLFTTRKESIAEKPSMRNIFKYNRCIVPADGFVEWKKEGKTKTAFHYRHSMQPLMLLAGIWDVWSKSGEGVYTFSIVTVPSGIGTKTADNRLPVVLSPDQAKQWLQRKQQDEDALLNLLQPLAISAFEQSAHG
jgi:putative SOS response-associated peptidase YedK